MFGFDEKISKVFNPLNISSDSIIEFNVGELANTGIYYFKKIIQLDVGQKTLARYLIFSKSENTEFVLEVFPTVNDQFESYLYSLKDTVPFSDEFLDVAGQLFLTTPDDSEYQRCIMPDSEERIDGNFGTAKIFDIYSNKFEKETSVKLWDYQREVDGKTEFLNLEMIEDTGMFRIFVGELIEDIFYKVYKNT